MGERIREVGHEYGTTTGRPRRVGWFDSVVMRHSRRVSGITNLSLNSIDVLSGLDTVKICVAYDLDGERIDHYPASPSNSNVANLSTKNCQAGKKILQVFVALMSFLKMPATTFVAWENWLAFAFQPSQLVQDVNRLTFWNLFGRLFNHCE